MWIVNSIAGLIVNGLLYPFRGMPPMVGLSVVSLLVGVGVLYVYKLTSDQDRIDDTKRKIHAGIFEIRLFNDDMRVIFTAQRDILRYNLTYLRLSFVPLLWMMVPFVVIVAQLQMHYGYEGLESGQPAILKVKLKGDPMRTAVEESPGRVKETSMGTLAAWESEVELEVPDGVRIDSPKLWIPSLNEIDWRVVADEPGVYELTVRVRDEVHTKSLVVSRRIESRSPIRVSGRLLDQILYPAESPMPSDAPIETIELLYPAREINFLGWETHWLIPFFIVTIIVAFALRKPLGVTF